MLAHAARTSAASGSRPKGTLIREAREELGIAIEPRRVRFLCFGFNCSTGEPDLLAVARGRQVERAVRGVHRDLVLERDLPLEEHVRDDDLGLGVEREHSRSPRKIGALAKRLPATYMAFGLARCTPASAASASWLSPAFRRSSRSASPSTRTRCEAILRS